MDEKKRILIVDDDEAILNSLRDILQEKGYEVVTAKTGREAIKMSEAQYFDLALLDIKLPDIEGTELLTEMHKKTPSMMKIMITGYPSLENAVEALNLGADAYVMKPIDNDKLLKIMEEKLREQEEAMRMTQEKVDEWILNRLRE